MRIVSTLIFVALMTVSAWAQTNYYSAGNNDVTLTSSWWTNTNGTGSHPTDFTTAGQVFNVQNGHAMTASAAWTVSGTGSKVVIETGGKISTGAFSHSITLDMQSGAEYSIGNTSYGIVKVGTWDNNSTIRFTTPPSTFRTISHPNVIMDFSVTKSVSGTLTVLGDFTMQNSGTFNVAGTSTAGILNIGGSLMVTGGTFSTGSASGVINFTNTGKASGNITVTSGTLVLGTGTADTINIAPGRTVGLGSNISIGAGSIFIVNGSLSYGSNTIAGSGGFTLASGATLTAANTGGVNGTIQTSGTNSLSTGANYTFDGSSALATGTMMPTTVNNITVNNPAGVTLSQSTSAASLTFAAGKISTGGNTLSVAPGSITAAGSSSFVDGNLAYNVGSTGTYVFATGQGSDYLPVTMNFTSLTGSDIVTVSAVSRRSTPLAGSLGGNKVLDRYFKFTKGSGITVFSVGMTLTYADADVVAQGIGSENSVEVFQWDGARWTHRSVVARNTMANTLDISGITNFSDFVLSGTGDSPLPVQMESMSAMVEGGTVKLSFQTATEVDVSGFNISRSLAKDGPFELISSYASNMSLKASGGATSGGSYTFVDRKVSSGQTYYYRIDAVNKSGKSEQVGGIIEVVVDVPKEFELFQNYPNPFNPTTAIRLYLKEPSNVTLDVYDVLGRRVEEWNYGMMDAGRYDKEINMDRYASGVYYYRISVIGTYGDKFSSAKRMVLMK